MDPIYIWAAVYWPVYIIGCLVIPRCGCGKQKLSVLLFVDHRRLPLLLIMFLSDVGTLILWILMAQPRWVIAVWVMYAMLAGLRIYYHEKDKLKKAAKALGRVFVTNSGRLAIAKE